MLLLLSSSSSSSSLRLVLAPSTAQTLPFPVLNPSGKEDPHLLSDVSQAHKSRGRQHKGAPDPRHPVVPHVPFPQAFGTVVCTGKAIGKPAPATVLIPTLQLWKQTHKGEVPL